jgi:hypothetical protein
MSNTDKVDISENGNNRRLILGITGVVLIAVAIAMATFSIVSYVAVQQAEEEQAEESRRVLLNELENQMSLARDNFAESNLELALKRLEWILDLDPGYAEAVQLLGEVQSALDQSATSEPTGTSIPLPTPTSSFDSDAEPEAIFSQLEELIQDEQWLSAVNELTAFQFQYPNFSRRETDRMLFDASTNLGLELLQGDQIELGLYYITQAEKLGDLPEEIDAYRTWAELYLLGIGYFGVDWGQTIYYFRGLCSAAPYYQDSCTRLYESLVAYGDIFTAALDWCPAEELYFEAILYDANDVLTQKLEDARAKCLEATPTPTVAITSTVTITVTPTLNAE